MVLDNLGSSLRNTLKKIANAPYVDKELIKEVVRDVQRALLQADVNVQMVLNLTKQLELKVMLPYNSNSGLRKGIVTLTLTVGMLIFSIVVWYKVEVWAEHKKAETALIASEMNWGGYLYKKTVDDMLEKKQGQ